MVHQPKAVRLKQNHRLPGCPRFVRVVVELQNRYRPNFPWSLGSAVRTGILASASWTRSGQVI
jgi:hypothetical protein